jgi:hypothetical protein
LFINGKGTVKVNLGFRKLEEGIRLNGKSLFEARRSFPRIKQE